MSTPLAKLLFYVVVGDESHPQQLRTWPTLTAEKDLSESISHIESCRGFIGWFADPRTGDLTELGTKMSTSFAEHLRGYLAKNIDNPSNTTV